MRSGLLKTPEEWKQIRALRALQPVKPPEIVKKGRPDWRPVTEESLRNVRIALDANKRKIDIIREFNYTYFFIKKNIKELVKRGFERFNKMVH